MSKEKKLTVAKGLASQLGIAEEAIDTAMSEAAQLIETCVNSRRAVRLSSTHGQDIYRHTLDAMQALSTAQQKMAAAHHGLRQVNDDIGLGTVNYFPVNEKPEGKARTDTSARLPVEETAVV